MKYTVLATDYDGTLATDGVVDDGIVETLRGARARGLRMILVTGRELTSLFNTFAHGDLFEFVVAENGAVLHAPSTESVDVIGPPPPPALLAALQHRQVPISVGHSIVATLVQHEDTMLTAIRSLGLDWHGIHNKGSVMALPANVTKATGLAVALRALGVEWQQCVGVGDAENDLDFLQMCGLSAAVSNALPEVKEMADIVLASSRGAGVIELVARLMAGTLDT